MQLKKDKLSDEKVLEIAINAGAKDCLIGSEYHEILSEKEDFYKVKSEIEKIVGNFDYSGIEWRPHISIKISKEQKKKIVEVLESLEEIEDVQKTFINCSVD